MIDDTHEALFHLADTLLRHGTVVEGNVGMCSRATTDSTNTSQGFTMGASLVDQYPITLVHIMGFKIIKN